MPKTKTYDVIYFRESDFVKAKKSAKDVPVKHITIEAVSATEVLLQVEKPGRMLVSFIPRGRGRQKPQPTSIPFDEAKGLAGLAKLTTDTANLVRGRRAHTGKVTKARISGTPVDLTDTTGDVAEASEALAASGALAIFDTTVADETPWAEVVEVAQSIFPNPYVDEPEVVVVNTFEPSTPVAVVVEELLGTEDAPVAETATEVTTEEIVAAEAEAIAEAAAEPTEEEIAAAAAAKAESDKQTLLARLNRLITNRESLIAYYGRRLDALNLYGNDIVEKTNEDALDLSATMTSISVRQYASEILAKDHGTLVPEIVVVSDTDRDDLIDISLSLADLAAQSRIVASNRAAITEDKDDVEAELETLKALRAELTGEAEESEVEEVVETVDYSDIFAVAAYIVVIAAFAGVLIGGHATVLGIIALFAGIIVLSFGLRAEFLKRS